jgi:hypothetical protein
MLGYSKSVTFLVQVGKEGWDPQFNRRIKKATAHKYGFANFFAGVYAKWKRRNCRFG